MINGTGEKPISIKMAYSLLLIFVLMGLAYLYVSISSIIKLLIDLNAQPDFVSIRKGAYYLFGAGIAWMMLLIGLVSPRITNKAILAIIDKNFKSILIGGVVIMIVFPHIIHYVAADYLEDHNYQVCEAKSTQWLFVSTIVYAKSLPCNES